MVVNIKYVKNVRIIGSTLCSRTPEVKPTIYKGLPITEAEAAHAILYKGQNSGKVVLAVK